MIYADEIFYTETYLSGRKPVIRDGFSFYAREASKIIDRHTFHRLSPAGQVPEDVRMCCCELAEQCFRAEQQKKEAGKTSEKVGTYSVTFASGSESNQSDRKEKQGIVMKWLSGTGLCYRGI